MRLFSFAFACVLLILSSRHTTAFTIPPIPGHGSTPTLAVSTSDAIRPTTTALMAHNTNSQSRRAVLGTIATSACLLLPSASAHAKPPPLDPTTARTRLEYELHDPNGGIATLQHAIDQGDFARLLEFTKTYDQVLRKQYMGALKKVVVNGTQATSLSNAVTFDLIGINRSSRPGQTSVEQAQKYLNELKVDVQAFLDLSTTTMTTQS
jgi:hypothetical protein